MAQPEGSVSTDEQPKGVIALSIAFAKEVKKFVKDLPSETRLGDLRTPGQDIHSTQWEAAHFLPDYNPPEGWEERVRSEFSQGEKIAWSVFMKKLMAIPGAETIEDIQKIPLEQLADYPIPPETTAWLPVKKYLSKEHAEIAKEIFG